MRVLVLQKPEVIERQRRVVDEALAEVPGLYVDMARSADEARRFSRTDTLITPTLDWLPEALEHLSRVNWIHFLSAGVDRIWEMDVDWSRYRLSKSAGVHAATISEFVLGAILYRLKNLGRFQRQQERGEWSRFWLDECTGKTLGIVGAGTIGSALARHASALGMRVLGVVRSPRPIENVEEVLGMDGLGRLLEESDFVVLLVPLTEATRRMIGAAELAKMKTSACLINVARGEVVDEAALVEALREGRPASAVLDVFDEEPLPSGSPLWTMENVLVTPHVAGTTQHYMARALGVFKDNLHSLRAGAGLTTPVSVEKGY